MGWFKRGKHESLPLSEVLGKSDREINRMIRRGEVPTEFTSAKVLRKAAKREEKHFKRATEGERGLGALAAGLKGGGSHGRNYRNIPLKDRVHPSEYRRILQREAKKQGLL